MSDMLQLVAPFAIEAVETKTNDKLKHIGHSYLSVTRNKSYRVSHEIFPSISTRYVG
jgi:hypothetical protein